MVVGAFKKYQFPIQFANKQKYLKTLLSSLSNLSHTSNDIITCAYAAHTLPASN